MFALIATTLLAASGDSAPQQGPTCSATKLFVGTAPSDIVQQKFEARFDLPLSRIDCKDNGLCYQKWGKNCSQVTK
jgi:hypothetical protein